MTILENVGICLIVWACTYHIFGIEMQVGIIYMFITYLRQIFDPINRIVENVETVQEALVSINKVYEILEQKQYLENLEEGKTLERIQGKIEFRNVWFSYDNENWVLKNVSFTIPAGQSVAFVGKTGSGKTTITNLINRFYEIQKGEILIDDVNIKEMNIRDLRQHIGMILQDPFAISSNLFGIAFIILSADANSIASSIFSSEIIWFKDIFSRILLANTKGSCKIIPICCLKLRIFNSLIFTSSIKISPFWIS